jgi:hypothetical protein
MAEVLYEPAFASGDRKTCSNCGLFVRSEPTTCAIHGPVVAVRWDAICGYHVPGVPMSPDAARAIRVDPVSPALSGLESVRGGTSCDRCVYYQDARGETGTCIAVDKKPRVAARACCSRWVALR